MGLFRRKEKEDNVKKYIVTCPVNKTDHGCSAVLTIIDGDKTTVGTIEFSDVFCEKMMEQLTGVSSDRTKHSKFDKSQRLREAQLKNRRDNNVGHKFINRVTGSKYTLCGIATAVQPGDPKIRGIKPDRYYYVDNTDQEKIFTLGSLNGATEYHYILTSENRLPIYLVMEENQTLIELITSDDFYAKENGAFVYKKEK